MPIIFSPDKIVKNITIKEIAKLAGVSTQTISRILNKKYDSVNGKTRERIEKIIAEVNYKPNLIARGLKRNSMNLVAVILPDVGNPAWSEAAKGICAGLAQKEYFPILVNTNEDEKEEVEAIEKISSILISGILLIPSHSESRDYNYLNSVNYPLVILDRLIPGINKDSVIFNNYRSAYEATDYLIKNGHKSIVVLNGDRSLFSAQSRYNGWKKAMQENNLYRQGYEFWGSFSIDSGYRMTKNILKEMSFSSIFAGNDLIAIGAKKAIEESGLKIPADISIVGFDDILFSSILNPPLTTIRVPLYELGLKAADLIIERIHNPEGKIKKIKLKCEMVERSSVKKLN